MKLLQHYLKVILAIGIALIAVAWLVTKIELDQVIKQLNNLPIYSLFIGFVCYLFFVATKAGRFSAILGLDRSILALFPIFSIHTFLSNILPFRSADLSYLYMMKKEESVGSSSGVISLILASVIDLSLILVILAITSFFAGIANLSYVFLFYLPIFCSFVFILIIIIVGNLASKPMFPLRSFLENFLINTKLDFLVSRWFLPVLDNLWASLTNPQIRKRQLGIWVLSILSLFVRFSFQVYLIHLMASDLSISEIIFALSFTNLCNLLPIQSVGNLGTIEVPFTWALINCHIPFETALTIGLSLHLIILTYATLVGLIGWVSHNWPK